MNFNSYGMKCPNNGCNHFMYVTHEDQATCYCHYCKSTYAINGFRDIEPIEIGKYDATKKKAITAIRKYRTLQTLNEHKWNVVNGHAYKLLADIL